MKLNNLPKEILLKIYEYDPTYKLILDSVMNDLCHKATLNRMYNLWKIWIDLGENDARPPSIIFLLEDIVNDPEFIVNNLSKCNCCTRHVSKRPLHLYDRTWIENDLANPLHFKIENDKNCKCICRHSSRWLCRTFNSYFNY
tara:strand:- start:49 stop:474 length:426 start_codon:yes stop_codon:yes gene_type:complete